MTRVLVCVCVCVCVCLCLCVCVCTALQVASYQRRLMYWRTKRTLAKPVNFCRVTYRYRKKVTLRAPRENSLVFNGYVSSRLQPCGPVAVSASCRGAL